jgi:hypothetical protein
MLSLTGVIDHPRWPTVRSAESRASIGRPTWSDSYPAESGRHDLLDHGEVLDLERLFDMVQLWARST